MHAWNASRDIFIYSIEVEEHRKTTTGHKNFREFLIVYQFSGKNNNYAAGSSSTDNIYIAVYPSMHSAIFYIGI
jgi:hypothetical protein